MDRLDMGLGIDIEYKGVKASITRDKHISYVHHKYTDPETVKLDISFHRYDNMSKIIKEVSKDDYPFNHFLFIIVTSKTPCYLKIISIPVDLF